MTWLRYLPHTVWPLLQTCEAGVSASSRPILVDTNVHSGGAPDWKLAHTHQPFRWRLSWSV